jgi:Pyruvate/2-oxoacid:ferredoxin oxidoreductase gamma subunit
VTTTREIEPETQELERVTIRFAGDSGDGMQLTGTQFTRTAAVYGNDISTLPDFPAEIRAPAGSCRASAASRSASARATSTPRATSRTSSSR